ncbi:MAG: NAD-dependent epimerase/dehydratase family protein [Myxococcales bacterium]
MAGKADGPRKAGTKRSAAAGERGRSIAVTGAFGFLGRALIARLEGQPAVERIVALDLKPPPGELRKTTFVHIDLTHPRADAAMAEAMLAAGADTLVHLALLYNPVHNASYAHEVEAIGTLQLLAAATAAGVDALIAMSTTALYGAGPDNPSFLTEDRPLRPAPQSRFLADKLEVERQLSAFRAAQPGAAVAILRLASLLGPRVKNPVTQLLGRPIVPVLLGRDPLMQFLHEDDAVRALELAVLRRSSGTFNVAPRGALPLSSVLKLLGRTPLPLPGPIARLGMAALWSGLGYGTPPSWLDYLRYGWVADGSLAERELGLRYEHNVQSAVLAFGQSLGRLLPSPVPAE